jgi:antitoxin component of MazEF toxin-antitoxin module
MGYPTKVQLIERKASEQWYVNFPSALAQALELQKGEQVQWTIHDKGHLILSRKLVPPDPVAVKKTSR